MGSVTIWDLIQAYNVYDSGVKPTFNSDQGAAINHTLVKASQADPANGLIIVPPGVRRLDIPVNGLSSLHIMGFGSASVLKLGGDKNVNVLQASNISKLRISNLRIDGNRTGNTSGNGNGISLTECEDVWLENVEIVSCVADGFVFNQCTRVKAKDCRSSDNGRHGVSLNGTEFSRFTGCESFDNGQLGSAGDGDAFNLDVLSHHNQFFNCDGFETSLAGVRQGYGFHEVAGGGCYKNVWIGGNCEGNVTAPALVEPDSIFQSYIQLMTGGLGIGTLTPDASTILDLVSVRQGFRAPAMTTVQLNGIVSPAEGLIVYDLTANKYKIRTASSWETITSA